MTQPSEFRLWLADLTHTGQSVAADVIPNAIGLLAAYVESQIALTHPIRLFKYPRDLEEAFASEPPPDCMGFSHYVWNANLAYRFAEIVRRRLPACAIVFGGPNYPYSRPEQEAFLRQRPVIDFFVVKEGEQALLGLVQALIATAGDRERVKGMTLPGIHAVSREKEAFFSPQLPRLQDLSVIPSAYLTGKLDPFFDGVLQPILQTNRGCPYGCTYCVEGGDFYNKLTYFAPERTREEILYIGGKMAASRVGGGGKRNDLFIADSNFGMYRHDLDTCRALAESRRAHGWPEYIHVATGKEKKERVLEAARLLEGNLRLSGSVQSLDPQVQRNIKRNNISTQSLMQLALDASQVQANSYCEIIMALPGDTRAAHMETIRQVIEAGFNIIILYQLMLLPGTELASLESKARFGMVSRYRVLPRCYGEYRLFGETARVAEIEEICVAHQAFSQDDYLQCRRFHLIISIFYNDGIFSSLLRLLKRNKLSIFRWMALLEESELPSGLAELFQRFEEATRGELWESREELEAFLAQPGILERFLAGELGPNLLYLYKSLAITRHVAELGEIAVGTVIRCFREAGLSSEETEAFIREAVAFHVLSASNLFWNHDVLPAACFTYDIPAFEAAAEEEERALAAYRFAVPRTCVFEMDPEQQALVVRQIELFGDAPIGIARILSKVFLRRLFRKWKAVGPTTKQVL